MNGMSEGTVNIDSRIEYHGCNLGDAIGTLKCDITTEKGVHIKKTIKWDSLHKSEAEAIIEMMHFINQADRTK